MPLVNTCLCCSLLAGSILTGVTSMMLYVMSFGLEIWWIVEAKVRLPIPAYILALIYICMASLALVLLSGLRTQRTKLLLTWLLITLITQFPEAGMVLFMAIYHWNGDTYGIIELGMWILRLIFAICGMICTQSVWSHWKEEKMVMKSLSELTNANTAYRSTALQKHLELGYQNQGFSGSQMILSPPDYSTPYYSKSLKRSISSASQFNNFPEYGQKLRSPSLSPRQRQSFGSSYHLQNAISHQMLHQLNAARLASYRRNEFDTTKFTNGLRAQSQYDLPSFGLDPDAPVFLTGYTRGGLSTKISSSQPYSRPDSALQWYRPRSLINLDDDDSSSWSDAPPRSKSYSTQSLDRRRQQLRSSSVQSIPSRARMNFGYLSDETGITRGGVGLFNYNAFNRESQLSIGQFSDHVDKYRDVAL